MLKIENTDVYGWEVAIRGMRNPKNSWNLSDTEYADEGGYLRVPNIGKKDLKLMKTLAAAGNDHGKFMRMITVTCDIIAPLYWWKEFDTYKVGTVADSCSTMHKIADKEFALDDFSREHLCYENTVLLGEIIYTLNDEREAFNETKDKYFWWQMIQLLPSSYNQRRTVQMNYAVLKNMYHARKNHKLDEWHTFCDWVETLPYSELICGDKK
jgi:hypothetical protein